MEGDLLTVPLFNFPKKEAMLDWPHLRLPDNVGWWMLISRRASV